MAKINFNRNKIKTLKNLQRFLYKDLIKSAISQIAADFYLKNYNYLHFYWLLQVSIWKVTAVCNFKITTDFYLKKL